MKRIFIEDSRISSLVNDLRERVKASLEVRPDLTDLYILCVGESGLQVGQVLVGDSGEGVSDIVANKKKVHICAVQKEDGILNIQFLTGKKMPFEAFMKETNPGFAYLLIDGICRSGQTLTSIYRCIAEKSTAIWSYSIAVSVGSTFIPTWYGCMFEGNEYVVLTRNGMTPNTALHARHGIPMGERLPSPGLIIRPPLKSDPDFIVDTPSLDRYTTADRYFDSITKSKDIIVLEWDARPVGFAAFHIDQDILWINYIVSCGSHRDSKPGIGTALYYHVEVIAKMKGCKSINLWAIENRVDWYVKRGFVRISSVDKIKIGLSNQVEESYVPMAHPLKSEFGHYMI